MYEQNADSTFKADTIQPISTTENYTNSGYSATSTNSTYPQSYPQTGYYPQSQFPFMTSEQYYQYYNFYNPQYSQYYYQQQNNLQEQTSNYMNNYYNLQQRYFSVLLKFNKN